MSNAGEASTGTERRERVAWVAVLVGVILVILVAAPRFALHRDIDVDGIRLTPQSEGWYLHHDDGTDLNRYSFDLYEYIASVDYYRGDYDRYPLYGPWRWRVVPSWIAAWTPIENPAVAYGAVSMGFMVAGAVALVAAGARSGLRRRAQVLVAVFYAVSFPMFWYSTSGYVDGSLIAMLCIGLCTIQYRRWLLFLLLLPVGFLVKETYLIIVPVAAAHLWARSHRWKDWVPLTAAATAIIAMTWIGVRLALPTPRTIDWMPRLGRLQSNLRPSSIASFLLSCGVVVPLALVAAWQLFVDRHQDPDGAAAWRDHLHLVVGLAMAFAITAHGFLTAYSDGRHVWTATPFAAILAALLVQRWAERRSVVAAQR